MTDKKVITELVNNSYWFEKPHDNAATTYASGEVVGTIKSLPVKGAGGGGLILDIVIVDASNIKMPMRIWFFRRRPSAFVDGDTFLPNRTDMRKFARFVDVDAGNYTTIGALAVGQLPTSVQVKFSCPDGELWYYVEARGAGVFPFANSLDILFGDWPD